MREGVEVERSGKDDGHGEDSLNYSSVILVDSMVDWF